MDDRFLREVRDIHMVRRDIRNLPDDEAEQMMRDLGPRAIEDWALQARDAQLPPDNLDWCWLLLGGRGFGKTRSLSGMVHTAIRAGIRRIHFIAPTANDYVEVNVEGASGIINTHGRDPRPRWSQTRRRLEWANGAVCIAENTPITMSNGTYKRVQEVVTGDLVQTPIGLRVVTRRGMTKAEAQTIILHTSRTSLQLTPDHLVYVPKRLGWIEARNLFIGDELVSWGPEPRFFPATLERIEEAPRRDCYDLTVAEAECYYASGILVHNCMFFSGDEPDSLRGPQCELALIDEIGRMRYQQTVFDMTMLGLRLGDKPRLAVATTPKPTPFMKKLVKMQGVSISTGSTYDNARNLAPAFLQKVRELYEGTRLGRQELQGAMILDPPSPLFKDEWIILHDVPEEMIEQATVGVDPSGGEDEVGIIVSALLNDGRFAVLADRSTSGSPGTWGDEAVRAHDEFDCDDIVVEVNFGGAMATDVIKQAADRAFDQGRRETNLIRITPVTASRGKAMRAEPISLLYERGRVVHRRGLDQLESEMMGFSREWDRERDGSPNRLDAAVWSLTRLSKVKTEIPMAS